MVDQGFEVSDLPVRADGHDVDHIFLARIDTAPVPLRPIDSPAGDKDLDAWMASLGAVLIVNSSYFDHHGEPDTPFLSGGVLLGPKDYGAKAGAFVATVPSADIRNLSDLD